jgi:hypothetical protein
MLAASIIALMVEAINASESSANFYEIILQNIPEDSYFQIHIVSLALTERKKENSQICTRTFFTAVVQSLCLPILDLGR